MLLHSAAAVLSVMALPSTSAFSAWRSGSEVHDETDSNTRVTRDFFDESNRLEPNDIYDDLMELPEMRRHFDPTSMVNVFRSAHDPKEVGFFGAPAATDIPFSARRGVSIGKIPRTTKTSSPTPLPPDSLPPRSAYFFPATLLRPPPDPPRWTSTTTSIPLPADFADFAIGPGSWETLDAVESGFNSDDSVIRMIPRFPEFIGKTSLNSSPQKRRFFEPIHPPPPPLVTTPSSSTTTSSTTTMSSSSTTSSPFPRPSPIPPSAPLMVFSRPPVQPYLPIARMHSRFTTTSTTTETPSTISSSLSSAFFSSSSTTYSLFSNPSSPSFFSSSSLFPIYRTGDKIDEIGGWSTSMLPFSERVITLKKVEATTGRYFSTTTTSGDKKSRRRKKKLFWPLWRRGTIVWVRTPPPPTNNSEGESRERTSTHTFPIQPAPAFRHQFPPTTTTTTTTQRPVPVQRRRGPTFNCRVLNPTTDGRESSHNDRSCVMMFPGIPRDRSCRCLYEVDGRDSNGCARGYVYTCSRQ